MKVKTIVTEIALENHEIEALKTIANIPCEGVSCESCPLTLDMKTGSGCIAINVRDALDKLNIDY